MRLSLPTTLLGSGLSETVTQIRDRLEVTSQEAVTGRYSDLTSHLSGRIGHAMLSQKALDDVANERTQLNLKASRLDIIQNALDTVDSGVSNLGVRMITAMNSEDYTARETVVRDARAALTESFSVLNTRLGERYLFSGDATSTKPFGDPETLLSDIRTIAASATDAADFETQLDAYFNTPGSGWQANVYAGTATASDPSGVTGMDPSIIDIVSGLAVLSLSGSDETLAVLSGDSDAVRNAVDSLANGQAKLTDVRAERGILQSQIAHAQTSLDLEETILTQTFNQMTARDQYEAASELQNLETSLEASYTLTARLSNLTLLNYIK